MAFISICTHTYNNVIISGRNEIVFKRNSVELEKFQYSDLLNAIEDLPNLPIRITEFNKKHYLIVGVAQKITLKSIKKPIRIIPIQDSPSDFQVKQEFPSYEQAFAEVKSAYRGLYPYYQHI